jgi:hypothetical protein
MESSLVVYTGLECKTCVDLREALEIKNGFVAIN